RTSRNMEFRPPTPSGTAVASSWTESGGCHEDPPVASAVRIPCPPGAPRPRMERGRRGPRGTHRPWPRGSMGLPVRRGDERAGPRGGARRGGASARGVPPGDFRERDGGRAEALVRMGKVVISVDLNPVSRTSQRATIPIVDELTRAILNTKKFVEELKENPEEAARVRRAYRRSGNLGAVYSFLEWRLGSLRRGLRRGEKRSRATRRKRATHRATGRHRQ